MGSPRGGVHGFLLHFHGRNSRCFPAAAFSDVISRVYQPSVSATNQVFNIVAIPSGVYRYWREGRMVWPLTWMVIAGTLPGVFIGAVVRVAYLPNPKHFKFFAAWVLLYIGIKMVRGLMKKSAGGNSKTNSEKQFQELVRSDRSKTAGAATEEEKVL